MELRGEIQEWNVSGIAGDGRKYIMVNTNYGLFNTYFQTCEYDVNTGSGEQRESNTKHVNRLKRVIQNKDYTPDCFTGSVVATEQVFVEDGVATIQLDELNKLVLLNGEHRRKALHTIWQEGETARRKIENLPIPLMVLLEPQFRKKDFVNLNSNLSIERSHLLNIKIDEGLVDHKKLSTFQNARMLALALYNNVDSPFHHMIKFSSAGCAPIAFSSIVTDRKSDLLGSLFFSSKLLSLNEQPLDWFVQYTNNLYKFIKENSNCCEPGKLICMPPDGPKGVANVFISVCNQFAYYLYLHGVTIPRQQDLSTLKEALRIYDYTIDGDLTCRRKANLARDFSQNLFFNIAEDEESVIGCHFGIPICLIVQSSPACFGIEAPPMPIHIPAQSSLPIQKVCVDSDTDEEFNK